MNFSFKASFAASFLLLMLLGCDSEQSSNVPTDDIFMVARVEVDASQNARVRIELKQDNLLGNSLIISGDDHLSLAFNGRDIPLTQDIDLLDVDYEGSLNIGGETGTFLLTFERSGSQRLTYQAQLNATFDITSPVGSEMYTSSDRLIDVTWSNQQDNAEMLLHGRLTCTTIEDDLDIGTDSENETWTVSDQGNAELPLYKLIANLILEVTLQDEEIVPTEPCELEFDLARTHSIALGDLASGSFFKVQQIRHSQTFNVFGIDSE